MQNTSKQITLQQKVVQNKQIHPSYRHWFLKTSFQKAAFLTGNFSTDATEIFEKDRFSAGNQATDVLLLLNFSSIVHEQLSNYPAAGNLNVKLTEQYFKSLFTPSLKMLYGILEKGPEQGIFRKSNRPPEEIALPPKEIKDALKQAISECKTGIKSKQKATRLNTVFEFFRQIIRIKPFEDFNMLMALLFMYDNLIRAGFLPVPFPGQENITFTEWMERYAMDKATVLQRMEKEYEISVQNALSFAENEMVAPEEKTGRLEEMREHFGNKAEDPKSTGPDLETLRRAYKNTIYPVVNDLFKAFEEIHPFFNKFELNSSGLALGVNAERDIVITELKRFMKDPASRYFNINFHWRELKKGGSQAFGCFISLQIEKDTEKYYFNHHDGSLTSYTLRWDEDLSENNRHKLVGEMKNQIIDYIERYSK